MNNIPEPFSTQSIKLFEELGEHAIGALATCYNNKPYVRSVSCIINDGKVFFQSDKRMKKSKQILEEPFVSICFRHIQIRGICSELEHPLHPNNSVFFSLYSHFYPDAAHRYSPLKDERVYQIIPFEIETWRYLNGEPYQELYKMHSEEYQIIKYCLD